MEIVCQQCGDKGFENAYVYCTNCLNIAIHRYCLPIVPGTFDEFVSWLCVDCDPEPVSRFHLNNTDYSPRSVSQRSSEEQAIPELIKRPQSTFRSPLPKIKLKKKNGMTCTADETGEQRHHMSGSCRSHINVDLSEYALEHDSSSLGKSSKKIKKNGLASSEAETVDGRRESSHLHRRHKNLDLTDRANLECDLSPLMNSRENGIASTIAGIKKQNYQIKKNGLASSEAETVDGRCESSHLHSRHKNLDLTDRANLECDLSPLMNSRENGIAPTIAGIKKQNYQIKKNGLASSEAETVDGRCESSHLHSRHKNLNLTDRANLECDLSPVMNSRENGIAPTIAGIKKQNYQIKKNGLASSEAETVDGRCESSHLHRRHKNLDLTDRANLECDLSPLMDSRENGIASTIAGIKKQNCQIIPSQKPSELPAEHASNIAGSSPVCENLNVWDSGIDLSGRRLISDRSKVDEEAVAMGVPNSLEPHDGSTVSDQDYYLPAQPIIDEIWRGSFSILNKSYGLADGVVAHLSNKACTKVCEEAGLLPSSLCLEMLPKMTLWPKSFQESEPNDDSIALYFFPRRERFRRSFDRLIEDMIRRELAMRAVVKNAELLVFTSSELPIHYWKFLGNYFLWGVFRAKQDSSSSPEDHHLVVQNSKTESCAQLSSENDVGTDRERSSSIKKINILNARSPLSPLSNTGSPGYWPY